MFAGFMGKSVRRIRWGPSFEPDTDVITLTFRVKVDREGHARQIQENPDFKNESAAESLINEAIAGWEVEGLIMEARGWQVFP